MNKPFDINTAIREIFAVQMPDRPSQPPHIVPANDSFNEWDDVMIRDICGSRLAPRLAKPIQNLLLTLSQADMTRDSFGLNAEQFVRIVIPQLKQLRDGMIDAYKEL